MALPFSEWSREEKDEFAQRRMDEMKLVNERVKQRHLEVEKDRLKAEKHNSSVTKNLNLKRENAEQKIVPKIEREWDKGKELNSEEWIPPNHLTGFRSKNVPRSYDKQQKKDDDSWRGNPNSRSNQGFNKSKSFVDYRKSEDNKYGSGGYQKRRTPGTTYKSYQNSRFEEDQRSFNTKQVVTSPHYSDADVKHVKQSPKVDTDQVWRDAGVSDTQHKQNRVESWVKSLHTSSGWEDDAEQKVPQKEYFPSKETIVRRQPSDSTYNQEKFPQKYQGFKDNGQYRNRRANTSYQGNSRGRGLRYYDDRVEPKFGNKTEGPKNQHKTRFTPESNSSRWNKNFQERGNQNQDRERYKSDSKSSDYSGRWEDDERPTGQMTDETHSNVKNFNMEQINKLREVHVVDYSDEHGGRHDKGSFKARNSDRNYGYDDTEKFNNNEIRRNRCNQNRKAGLAERDVKDSYEDRCTPSHRLSAQKDIEKKPSDRKNSSKHHEEMWSDVKPSGPDWDIENNKKNAGSDSFSKQKSAQIKEKNYNRSFPKDSNKREQGWGDTSSSLKSSEKWKNDWDGDYAPNLESSNKGENEWGVDSAVFENSNRNWADSMEEDDKDSAWKGKRIFRSNTKPQQCDLTEDNLKEHNLIIEEDQEMATSNLCNFENKTKETTLHEWLGKIDLNEKSDKRVKSLDFECIQEHDIIAEKQFNPEDTQEKLRSAEQLNPEVYSEGEPNKLKSSSWPPEPTLTLEESTETPESIVRPSQKSTDQASCDEAATVDKYMADEEWSTVSEDESLGNVKNKKLSQ